MIIKYNLYILRKEIRYFFIYIKVILYFNLLSLLKLMSLIKNI